MRYILLFIAFATGLKSWGQGKQALLFSPLPDSAVVLAPGFISTGKAERDFAISPAGDEIFFTLQSPGATFQTILYSRKEQDGRWTEPEVAFFAGRYSDLEPSFSPDGKRLYFSSNRPLTMSGLPKDFDIWYVDKDAKGRWMPPVNAGPIVNTPQDEFYPVATNSGTLYFTAAYDQGKRKEDIYKALWKDNAYEKPVPLDSAINTTAYEFNANISPDERLILYTSYGRKGDAGGGDLYMNKKDAAGNWLPAVNLTLINSTKLDYSPFLSHNGRILFFTSVKNKLPAFFDKAANKQEMYRYWDTVENNAGDIYWIRFDTIEKFYDRHLE